MTFEVTILGSSSALPTSQRYPSAHVLNVHERFFLIDCGEGTQMQLRRFRIRFGKINHIFISHLHGDHVFGLYGLLTSFNLLGRKAHLHLYVPPGTEEILLRHLQDYDVHMGYPLVFHALEPERPESIYRDKHVEVLSMPLKHRIPTWGFFFQERKSLPNIRKDQLERYEIPYTAIYDIKTGGDYLTPSGQRIPHDELVIPARRGRSYAYCSDTLPLPELPKWVEGTDLLYHEATYADDKKELALQTGHSTARQAATLAKKARAGSLLIGHFSARYKNMQRHLKEALEEFPEVILAEDGLQITVQESTPQNFILSLKLIHPKS